MDDILKKLDLLPEDVRSILIMTVMFAIFWRVCSKSIMQKHQDLLEAREVNSAGAESHAEENLLIAKKIIDESEAQLISERASTIKSLEPKLNAAKAEAAKILAAAEAAAEAASQKARAEINEENNRLFASLESSSEELAGHITDRVFN